MPKKTNTTIVFLKNLLPLFSSGSMPIFWVTFLSSILLTLMIWHTIKINIYNTAENNFNNIVSDTEVAISKRIMAYELVLKGTVGLFNSSEKVTRSEWHSYISSVNIESNYKGIVGIGFIEYVRNKNLKSHINEIRAGGIKSYNIFPFSPEKEHAPIIYFEPFTSQNKMLIGYDMFTDSVRKPIMLYSRDSGKACITTSMRLMQDKHENYSTGFLMFEPVYNGNSSTFWLRRRNFIGYIYAPVRMSNFVNSVATKEMAQISLDIYDGTNTKNLLYSDSNKVYKSNKSPMFTGKRIININNHSWLLVFNSLPEFENHVEIERPYYFLFAGLSISVLIFLLSLTVSSIRYNNLKLKQILSTTDEGIYGIDLNLNCTFINTSACRILGYEPKYLLNNNIHNIIHYKKLNNEEYKSEDCPITACIRENKPVLIDDEVFWKKDGSPIPVEYSSSPIVKNNYVTGAVVTFKDITERKNAIEKLENSIEEKTVLLKEVHHRVKNNLQIISSLLNLQAFQIKDENIQAIFKESQNRVLSMALIHEKLYQTNNMSHISFSGYLQELVQNLFRSYAAYDRNIDFELNLIEVDISIDTSITLGLIVNEIIANSLKHAFKGKSNGTIFVDLTKENDILSLKIKDDGVGIPDNFNYKKTSTLGFNIILNLIEQINGKLSINVSNGTELKIDFPYSNSEV